MRIALIAHGWLPIPPPAWGAIEILIWDMYIHFTKLGHQVLIVNTHDQDEIVTVTNNFNPDIVHLHWDEYYPILSKIHCSKKFVTGHKCTLPLLENAEFHQGEYTIATLSVEIKDKYIHAGCPPNKLIVLPNAVNEDFFCFNNVCARPEHSVYVGNIDERKKQYKYTSIPNLYFIGNVLCSKFKITERHLGEWKKQTLYSSLTEFANLVLLSDAECHPLVVCEALICGLGVVVSEAASANLDSTYPWITIIPNDKLDDIEYVASVIEENRIQSIKSRQEIREYALRTFSWSARIPEILRLYHVPNKHQ
jgi:glycosyltransferase involved in cell wall biosynthesis